MIRTLVLLAQAVSSPPPAQLRPPPPACSAPEHRQFDFWVGQWDVYRTGQAELRAHSLIENLYGGCVIRENWMPLQGSGGGSLNHYDRNQGRWHQTWIDGSGERAVFEGGLVDGKMVLLGFWKGAAGPGKDGLVRTSWSRLEAGAVRQLGEISTDQGLTWKPLFDFTYRPSAAVK